MSRRQIALKICSQLFIPTTTTVYRLTYPEPPELFNLSRRRGDTSREFRDPFAEEKSHSIVGIPTESERI